MNTTERYLLRRRYFGQLCVGIAEQVMEHPKGAVHARTHFRQMWDLATQMVDEVEYQEHVEGNRWPEVLPESLPPAQNTTDPSTLPYPTPKF